MSELCIEAACQQVRAVCNHGAVFWKIYRKEWSTFRHKEYGSSASNARAVERCRLGLVFRGSKLDEKSDAQLIGACGPSSSGTADSVRG
jgi:hypothetical protein